MHPDSFCAVEVRDLELHPFGMYQPFCEENICWLQIAMNNPFPVQVAYALQQLEKHSFGTRNWQYVCLGGVLLAHFWKRAASLHKRLHAASLAQLHTNPQLTA